MAEEQLEGGIANAGRVVRDGPYVLRASNAHSGSIHAFLRAAREAGFEGASLPVGIDQDDPWTFHRVIHERMPLRDRHAGLRAWIARMGERPIA